jgi:hypothetical protein
VDHRRALGRRQVVGEVLQLGVGGACVRRRDLVRLARRAPPPQRVDGYACGDRVRPSAEVAAVLEPFVAAERAEERLLERVLGFGGAEPSPQKGEDLAAPGLVEAFERRNGHGVHHGAETGGAAGV